MLSLLELELLNVGLNPLGKLLVILHSSLYVVGGDFGRTLQPLLDDLETKLRVGSLRSVHHLAAEYLGDIL
mgnify:CR=1 FL=1